VDSEFNAEKRAACVVDIEEAPKVLEEAVTGLSDSQLATPYRPGGWTIHQVVHHVADSHMNGLVRFKLALTEDSPPIKLYSQPKWAELADVQLTPIAVSLTLLRSLHAKWLAILGAMQPQDFAKTVQHPEQGNLTLDVNVQLYAWHGKHHAAHITSLRDREGWW
jgi:uncharacterized damage-inducible protein DinB